MPFKIDIRRNLSISKRDIYGISSKEMIIIKQISKALVSCGQVYRKLKATNRLTEKKKRKLKLVMSLAVRTVHELLWIDPVPPARRVIAPRKTSFNDFDPAGYSQKFRFRSAEDLRRLAGLLRFPVKIKLQDGRWSTTFTSEEVIMVSLMRLAWPLRWIDVSANFPGRTIKELQVAFYYFLDFLVTNWGYLITNNREYWLPHFKDSADHIRRKLGELSNVNYRQFFNEENENGGFSVFGFIDNTLIAMSRPGGPRTAGTQAERTPKLLQQAWWTGWKKLHGMKWQTVVMANGMDFEVWGPVSVRHPDAYTLNCSRIEEKLEALQANKAMKYKMHGDSAYFDDDYLVTGGGRGMSSTRESIEWDYRDLKAIWKVCDWRIALQLRRQPVAKIVFVCFLLRIFHVCMYANQSADYFAMLPPELEHYLGQGPGAKPLPTDCIFSPHFQPHPAQMVPHDYNADNEYDEDDE